MEHRSQLFPQETTGKNDCLRACIATLLEEPVESVPNFTDREPAARDATGEWLAWHAHLAEWLAPRGLAFLEIALVDSQPWLGFPLGSVECIFIGAAPDGRRHAVVGRCEARKLGLVFDPHPSRAGLIGVDSVAFLIPFVAPKERRIIF